MVFRLFQIGLFWSEGGERRIRLFQDVLSVAISITIGQAIEQVGVFELFHGSGLDEVLRYVAYKCTGDINHCADDSIWWIPYVWDLWPVRPVSIYNQESNNRVHSGAHRVVDEYATVEVSLFDQKNMNSLANDRLALETYKAKKHGTGSNVGGNESEAIP